MSVEYLEITETLYLNDCISIQKDLFNLSDIDVFPQAFFNMLIRKEHPLGLVVGCFKTEMDIRNLIGIGVAIADSEDNAAYVPFIGMKKEFHSGIYGYNLLLNLRLAAIRRGFNKIYALFNPLETHLGKLYTKVGMRVVKYISEPYTLNKNNIVSPDKVLISWDLKSDYVLKKINREYQISLSDLISELPIARDFNECNPEFLIELPDYTFSNGTTQELASPIIKHTQEILEFYINKKNYIITDCLSSRLNNRKNTFYLLSNN